MTLNEFVTKYSGKKVDWDNQFGAQCVDLYRFYAKEVLNFPQSTPVGGAYQIWDTVDPKYYEKIANSPVNFPNPNDVVIWNEGIGPFGHVAVCVDANVNTVKVFEQNNPIGSPCHLGTHDYKHVIGWLRPKPQSQVKTQSYKGELRIVLQAATMDEWKALTKVYGLDPNKINESVN